MVKEAASLKKYNLFTDSRDLLSQSSRSSLSSPSVSTPSSPAMALASPAKTSFEPQSPSPLAVNGVSSSPQKEEQQENVNGVLQSEASTDVTVLETPLGKVEQIEAAQSVAVSQEAEVPAPKAEDVVPTVKAEAGSPVAPETPALADTTDQSETQEVNKEAAPETVIQEEVISVQTETAETAAEGQTRSTDAPKEEEITLSEIPTVVESIKTDVEAAAAQTEAPVPSPDPANEPVNTSAEDTGSQTVASSEEKTNCGSSEIKLEAPSSGETPALTPADVSLDLKRQEAEPVTVSDPNSLDVSVGSESAPSDVESVEEVRGTQSSEDEVSTTSDVLEDEANLSKSPVSSDDPAEDKTMSDEPSPQAQTEAVSDDVCVGGDIEAGASVSAELLVETADATTSESSEPAKEEASSSPEAQPLDSIKEIRDLVVEVIEVEELVQRYPDGVPKEE